MLIDVVGEGPDARFRYALCGDRHVAHFGNDMTDVWLDRLFGATGYGKSPLRLGR